MTRTENEDLSNATSPSASNSSGVRSGFSPGQSSMGTAAPRNLVMRGRGGDDPEDSPAEGDTQELNLEGGGGSEAEEEYSDADSNSASAPSRPPNLADLILLDEGRCRAPMRSKIHSGAKLACICGKQALECKRHAEYRVTNDADRAEPGYYLRAIGVKGEHGMQGVRYPVSVVDELRALQDQEMNRAAQTLAMEDEDPDDSRGNLELSPRRVSFGATNQGTARLPHQPRGHPTVVDLSQSPMAAPPNLWFGLEDAAGDRWIVPNLTTAREYEGTGAFRLAKVFTDKTDAEGWKSNPGMRPSRPPNTTQASRKPTDEGPHDTYSGGSSSGDSSPQSRRRRSRKPRSSHRATGTNEAGRGSARRRKGSDSDSETSSLEGSSNSSTTSSSSSSSQRGRRKKKHHRRRRSGRRRRDSRGKMKKDPRQPGARPGEDKSTGDKDLIYGMSIHGTEIEAALGPDDMRPRDADELFNAAMDVTSLPGMFGLVGGVQFSDDMQGATEMAATLLSTAIGKKAQIHDSLWKTQKRHALGQVKDVKSLFSFVKSVSDAKRPAMDQQEHALQVFLRARRYDEDYTQNYVRTGFLVQLTTASFGYYSELLNTARQLAYDHALKWEHGPAKAMLEFHAKKLLEIRMFALTRKMLILRTYTYLRDASKQGFYDNRMNEALWKHALLAGDPTDSGGDQKETPTGQGRNDDSKQCSQCKSKRLHQLLRARHQRSACPFKDSTPKEAKNYARKALNILDEEGDLEGGIHEAVKRAMAM